MSNNPSLVRCQFLRNIGNWPCYDQVEHKVLELGICKLFEEIDLN